MGVFWAITCGYNVSICICKLCFFLRPAILGLTAYSWMLGYVKLEAFLSCTTASLTELDRMNEVPVKTTCTCFCRSSQFLVSFDLLYYMLLEWPLT